MILVERIVSPSFPLVATPSSHRPQPARPPAPVSGEPVRNPSEACPELAEWGPVTNRPLPVSRPRSYDCRHGTKAGLLRRGRTGAA